MNTLRRGSSGEEVRRWQGVLAISESGDFDDATERETKIWQARRGLAPDGIVGPMTWAATGLVWTETEDIDDAFFPMLRLVAMALQAKALDIMSVMYSESGCKATAWNDNPKSLPPTQRWNASGLIQFMPATLMGLGWHAGHAAFRTLSATQQLPWVERYYRPYRGFLDSVGGLYVATFLPALIKHSGDPNFVLTAKAGALPWAYAPNAVFDTNHDLRITVSELEQAVARNCRGARWGELCARLSSQDNVDTAPELENPSSDEIPVVNTDIMEAVPEPGGRVPTICPPPFKRE